MTQANISTTKNNLCNYLEKVKQGETILILDRDQPIATLSPYQTSGVKKKWSSRIAFLSKNSKITLPKRSRGKAMPLPLVTKKPVELVQALLEERATAR